MESLELVDSLGKCEKCGTVVSVTEFAGDGSMNAVWKCHCGQELTHTSFGYDKGESGAKKVRWIGKNLQWTSTKPTDGFDIGKTTVTIDPIRMRY
jgi:hypothetical protein